jgi:biotin synthase-like enzyme
MIIEYAEKVLKGGEISREEAIELIKVPDQDTMLLLAMADRIRQRFNGDEVEADAAQRIANFVLNPHTTIQVLRNIHSCQ